MRIVTEATYHDMGVRKIIAYYVRTNCNAEANENGFHWRR